MKLKKELYSILFILILLLIGNVSAITGSIGNARMVLRLKQGDSIDKCILVKNVNDVSVDIELVSSGELAEYIKIKDEKFTLRASEEKNACFTLEARKDGTSESKINVMFTPQEGSAVGLSSTIIVIAEKNSLFNDIFGNDEDSETEENEESEIIESDDKNTEDKSVSVSFGNKNPNSQSNSKSYSNKSLIYISSGFTILLFAMLLILLIMNSMKNKTVVMNGTDVKKVIKSKKRVNMNE